MKGTRVDSENTSAGTAAAQPSPAFYNVAETAALLRLDQSTLYRHLRSGRFPAVKIGGRYVVPHIVLDRLVSEVLSAGTTLDVAEWAERTGMATGGAA